jgi:hypothetical protein
MSTFRSALSLAAFAALLVPASAPAAEPHRYLPDDTEMVISVNIKQLLSTKLFKDNVTGVLKDLIAGSEEAKDILKDLGFDPFKDLHRVLIASPGSTEADRGLIIVQGEFDVAKLKAKGEELAKNQTVKLHKIADGVGGNHLIFEMSVPGVQLPWFVCAAAKDAILISPGKDYVVDALKKNPIKNPVALKNKGFQDLLEKVDDKQTVYLAGTADAVARTGLGDLAKDYLTRMDGLAGGVKLEDDLHLEVVLGSKTVADARSLSKSINDLHTQGLLIVGLLATQDENLGPALDILKSLRCTQKDKAVTIKARIDAELLDKLLPNK